jgi:DNA-binding Lrp family transcriptional regulator
MIAPKENDMRCLPMARIFCLARSGLRVSISEIDYPARVSRMLDPTDSRLLAAVQADAQITAQELGERLNLSASQAARRRAKLEADGLITGYTAQLSPGKLGLTVQAFVQVQMAAHSPEAAKGFLSLISTLPEVVACWTLTGEADYLLRVWCADLPALNDLIHHRLLPNPAVARVQSQIVMAQPKADTGLPV